MGSMVELAHANFQPHQPQVPYDWAQHLPVYAVLKRALDVVVALCVLVVLLPLWAAIGALIKATSPGPVLHRATVVGRYGRPFTWYKFRTMRVAPDHEHRSWLKEFVLADQPYQNGVFKLTPDPRVTRVGAFLRRTSLDEIPQLINVLRGEMSVVGPRPPIEYEFSLYDDRKKARLAVKPGITGLFQVTLRSKAPFSAMLETDLKYINNRSLWLDLTIMARTVLVMAFGRGAA
jgi:lipopolysaccharide/colanic/teichoic acid biosynthesis glycosyltransferase